nr:piggyBac transposable element-derived protein 3-like [Leptinotarsa decemlineata]
MFNLFVKTEMNDIICNYTNQEACRYYAEWNEKNPNKPKVWTSLESEELDCFLGVLVKAGALRCRRESTKEIWSTNTSIRRSFFSAALPRNRFGEISSFLRFDDKSTRAQRKEQDKLAAIRDIWEMFVNNCKKAFEPYENTTIDEQLVRFRGRCPFRQYIKSKPGRYGIKIWAAADTETSYLSNLQVYTGKTPGGAAEKLQGLRVVSDLAEPYHGSWRGITTDDFFTSVALAQYLLTKQLTLLGTVRKKKSDTPVQLAITARPPHSSIFAFTKDLAMVSFIPKKNKMVHLLSSQHDKDTISDRDDNKSLMILDYNKTKGGVDTLISL